MITIELAKTGRSNCKYCKNKIYKNCPRIRFQEYTEFCVCFNCAIDFLRGVLKRKALEIDELHKSLEDWHKFVKLHSKEIVMSKLK